MMMNRKFRGEDICSFISPLYGGGIFGSQTLQLCPEKITLISIR